MIKAGTRELTTRQRQKIMKLQTGRMRGSRSRSPRYADGSWYGEKAMRAPASARKRWLEMGMHPQWAIQVPRTGHEARRQARCLAKYMRREGTLPKDFDVNSI